MKHIVIGGGIAGVCCVEELCRLQPSHHVTLISSSTVLKGVDTVIKITKTIEEVLVTEKDLAALRFPNLRVLQAIVTSIDTRHKVVHLQSGNELPYDKLCICLGAKPKVLPFNHERIITLRDTQSIQEFARQLSHARRIAVVGNGGIALELMGAVRDVEVMWVAEHGHIGDAFFDTDAAEFMLRVLQQQQQQQPHGQRQDGQEQQLDPDAQLQQQEQQQEQRQKEEDRKQQQQDDGIRQQLQQQQHYEGNADQQQEQQHGDPGSVFRTTAAAAAVSGHAAGPKWVHQLPTGKLPPHVKLEKSAVVVGVSSTPSSSQTTAAAAAAAAGGGEGAEEPHTRAAASTNGSSSSSNAGADWPLYLQLSNNEEVGVDLVVQAIGVEPATSWLPGELQRAPDGGILVTADLESSIPGIYAAGDCCTVDPTATAPHWFQMRLWTQARLMGLHAAAAMADKLGSEVFSFSFELFTHVTRFLGKKVVLLGLYNGQKLQHEAADDIALYTRVLDEGTEQATFVRVLLLRGKMQGAVLIGDTELEETFENLILDGLDLSTYGPALLDPDIELDHVFD